VKERKIERTTVCERARMTEREQASKRGRVKGGRERKREERAQEKKSERVREKCF